jgi:hypothetical protein
VRGLIPFAGVFAVGCATVTASVPVSFSFLDDPRRSGIEITYVNNLNTTMCLGRGEWPNPEGKFNQADNRVFLVVDGDRYPIQNTEMDYCVGGCPTYVDPGQRITSFIPYSNFNLPETAFNRSKKLDISPLAYVCKRR